MAKDRLRALAVPRWLSSGRDIRQRGKIAELGFKGRRVGKDKYTSFKALEASEERGKDYDVHSRLVLGSIAAIIAPHGGHIEPWTDKIADEIASRDFSFYAFQGLKPGSRLHITSSLFDEPSCLKIVAAHKHAVSIHGWSARGARVCIGGRALELIHAFKETLSARKIQIEDASGSLRGTDPNNIVNRCASGRGVQFEVTMALRTNSRAAKAFVSAVRDTLIKQQQLG